MLILRQELFQKHLEGDLLVHALEAEREFVMTPKSFMHNINRICLDNVRFAHPVYAAHPHPNPSRLMHHGLDPVVYPFDAM